MLELTDKERAYKVDAFLEHIMKWKKDVADEELLIEAFRDEYRGGWLVALLPHNEEAAIVLIDLLGAKGIPEEFFTVDIMIGDRGIQTGEEPTSFDDIIELLMAVRAGNVVEEYWWGADRVEVTLEDGTKKAFTNSILPGFDLLLPLVKRLSSRPVVTEKKYDKWSRDKLYEPPTHWFNENKGMIPIARF